MAHFPFSAVVGMDNLRLGLLLNAISPAIGGVLIRGEKGTAKSTMVRALSEVLPPVEVVAGCRFSCDPAGPDPECPDGPHDTDTPGLTRAALLRELPVGTTEDRLVGCLDIEKALTEGVKSFQPGLLADAHRGVLYVDEVNLLHDHLVDLLLDAAALGTSYIEREGVSVRHAARFLLVGTMNPEEGELRPQLLDRFGLTVEVTAPRDTALRAEVVRRRLAYDANPADFAARFAEVQAQLAERIAGARRRLPLVRLPDTMLARIAAVCAAFEVDGLRADIVMARAAIAHAAWQGRSEVAVEDVRVAAKLALPHRRRRNPFDAPDLDDDQLERALADSEPPEPEPDPSAGPCEERDAEDDPNETPLSAGDRHPSGTPPAQDSADGASRSATGRDGSDMEAPPYTEVASWTTPFPTRRLEVPGVGTGVPGRRSRAVTDTGQVVRTVRPDGPVRHLHLSATVAAAAPYQHARGRSGTALLLERQDLREALRHGREGNLVLFVVDASASMAARRRMRVIKGAILSLLLDAYQRRDKVGLITFRDRSAELTLPATSSVEAAAARLRDLPTGGRTPLADGLLMAHRTLERERLRDPRRRALLILVTDGRHTSGGDPGPAADLFVERRAGRRVAAVVVDCEAGRVRLGLAGVLAARLGGLCLPLDELGDASGKALAAYVRALRDVA